MVLDVAVAGSTWQLWDVSYIYTVGHKDGIFFSSQFHGIFLAVGDI